MRVFILNWDEGAIAGVATNEGAHVTLINGIKLYANGDNSDIAFSIFAQQTLTDSLVSISYCEVSALDSTGTSVAQCPGKLTVLDNEGVHEPRCQELSITGCNTGTPLSTVSYSWSKVSGSFSLDSSWFSGFFGAKSEIRIYGWDQTTPNQIYFMKI